MAVGGAGHAEQAGAGAAGAGDEPVPMDRFRPNVVVDGWDEPHIEGQARRINTGDSEL